MGEGGFIDLWCSKVHIVINVKSDTFGNPIFTKGLTKLAIILDYTRPWMLCLALQPRQKIGPDLPFWVVLKLKLQKKKILTKNVVLKSYSSMKKKSEIFE